MDHYLIVTLAAKPKNKTFLLETIQVPETENYTKIAWCRVSFASREQVVSRAAVSCTSSVPLRTPSGFLDGQT